VVAEVNLTRVLIVSGSGLNLIFASTLRKMGLDLTNMLVLSKSPFYSIVPGNAAHPLGTVVLPVTFGMRENYRTKFIKFEVANFKSLYHAILGRPALAKFMVVPHYVYLLLKMPGRSGVVTVVEPPELFRLKCASHRYPGDINSTHFKRNNPLVCRVSARYNHGSTGSK
jgi:hypothetical protein